VSGCKKEFPLLPSRSTSFLPTLGILSERSGPPILEYACESFWFLSAWGEYLEYKGEEDEEVSESDVFLQEFQLPKM
jgi:hypothetical protein